MSVKVIPFQCKQIDTDISLLLLLLLLMLSLHHAR